MHVSIQQSLPFGKKENAAHVYRQFHQSGERSNAAPRPCISLKRRRAKQCRRCAPQSAAKLPSLAPHGVGRGCNMTRFAEDSWRSHVHRTSTAQRVQSFKLQTRNVGGRGERPSSFSGGSKGGILFEKRIPPLIVQCRGAAIPLRKTLSPEARSCRGRREHENADAARSVPPARRCWTRRGNSQCPSPW